MAATCILRTALPLLLLVGLSIPAVQGQFLFDPPVYYEVGENPRAIARGDVDADGDLDLVTANMGAISPEGSVSGSISVLLNRGDGTFGAGGDFPVILRPLADKTIALGDVDSDGDLDVAVAGAHTPGLCRPSVVSILFNQGGGRFAAPVGYEIPGCLVALSLGDLSGDGAVDLAMADADDAIVVLLNRGDGTFAPARRYDVHVTTPALHTITMADLDGDGDLDLAATGSNGGMTSVLMNRGDGTFEFFGNFSGLRPAAMIAGDFDADRRLDLALASEMGPDVVVLWNNDDGSFTPTHLNVGQEDSLRTYGLDHGDLNGDGVEDLAVALFNHPASPLGPGLLTVLLGNGNRTFALPGYMNFPDRTPLSVAMGDFNGDRWLDIATANSDSTVAVLVNQQRSPVVAVFPASVDFGSLEIGAAPLRQTFIVSNVGEAMTILAVGAIALTGDDAGAFRVQDDLCSGSRMAQALSCTFTVVFEPRTPGLQTAVLAIPTNDIYALTYEVPLRGLVIGAQISVDPVADDFGRVLVGTVSAPHALTIANTGNIDLEVGSVMITGPAASAFVIQSDGCTGRRLVPAASCYIEVRFAPTSGGSQRAELTISSTDVRRPTVRVPLTGMGAAADIEVMPSAYDFGDVGVGFESAPQRFVVTNRGTVDLTISTLVLTGMHATAFHFQHDTCFGQTIPPLLSCTIEVVFAPPGAGVKLATLVIVSNDPDASTLSVPVQGRGLGSDIAITPPVYDFGHLEVGLQSAAQAFTVTNIGTALLVISRITLRGADATAFRLANDDCSGFAMAPGEWCTVEVVFTPASRGVKHASLAVPSNAPGLPMVAVAIRGEGVLPGELGADIAIFPAGIDFGHVDIGDGVVRTLTISNVGDQVLDLGRITLDGPDAAAFTLRRDTCSENTVPPALSCTLEVIFTPTDEGHKAGALRIPSNDSDTPVLDIPLTGTSSAAESPPVVPPGGGRGGGGSCSVFPQSSPVSFPPLEAWGNIFLPLLVIIVLRTYTRHYRR
jgi:hypothetical protein